MKRFTTILIQVRFICVYLILLVSTENSFSQGTVKPHLTTVPCAAMPENNAYNGRPLWDYDNENVDRVFGIYISSSGKELTFESTKLMPSTSYPTTFKSTITQTAFEARKSFSDEWPQKIIYKKGTTSTDITDDIGIGNKYSLGDNDIIIAYPVLKGTFEGFYSDATCNQKAVAFTAGDKMYFRWNASNQIDPYDNVVLAVRIGTNNYYEINAANVPASGNYRIYYVTASENLSGNVTVLVKIKKNGYYSGNYEIMSKTNVPVYPKPVVSIKNRSVYSNGAYYIMDNRSDGKLCIGVSNCKAKATLHYEKKAGAGFDDWSNVAELSEQQIAKGNEGYIEIPQDYRGKKLRLQLQNADSPESGTYGLVNIDFYFLPDIEVKVKNFKYKINCSQGATYTIEDIDREWWKRFANAQSGVREYVAQSDSYGGAPLSSLDIDTKNTYTYKRCYYVGGTTIASSSVQIEVFDYSNYKLSIKSYSNITGCQNNSSTAGKITVSASGGVSPYLYHDGKTAGLNSEFTYTTIGNKIIYVIDKNGCNAIASQEIKVVQPFSATLAAKDIVGCQNNSSTAGKITVTPSGGSGTYTYSSDDKNYGSSNEFTYTTVGNKTIYVKDNKGCKTSETKEIKLSQLFSATFTSTDIKGCEGKNSYGTVTVTGSGGTGPYKFSTDGENYSYEVSGGQNQPKKVYSYNAETTKTYYIKDDKGCEKSSNQSVKLINKLSFSSTVISADCKGENNGSITITANGGVGSYKYTLDNNSDYSKTQSSNVFSGLAPSSYTIKVKDANNCASESVATVGNNNLFVLPEPEVVNVKCFGKNTGSITLNPQYNKSGFNGKFNYWLNDVKKGTNVFAGLYADQYKVKAQPEGSKCVDSMLVTIPQPTELKYTVDVIKCRTTTSNDGQLTVTPSGGIAPYTIKVNGRTYNETSINNLPSSTYTVTVTDAEGCIANDNKEYTIARPETDLKLNVVEHKDVKCNGQSTGKIKVIATGGWGNYSYTLSPNKGKTRDSADYRIFENLPSLSGNTYKVKVEDKMGVTHDTTITIKQYDQLSASSKVTKEISCPGGDDELITVTITGGKSGYTLSLDGNTYYDESGKIEITGKKKGVYKYTVVDANECVSPEYTVKIDEPTAIVLSADAAGELKNGFNIPCADGTGGIVVSAKGGTAGYQFSIDGGPFTAPYGKDAKHTFSGLEAGEHKIMVKDGHECLVPVSVEVKLTKPEPIIITKIDLTQPLCNGGSDGEMTIVAKGGIQTKNYNFTLNSNSASEKAQHTFTGLAAKDNYHVVVTDANECFVEKDIDLGQPAKLEASVSNVKNNLCNGDELGIITFAVNGGIAPYGYSLNGKDKVAFSNDMTISGLPSLPNKTPHSIVVSDAHGCKADAIEQEITEEDKITAQTILNDYNGYNVKCYGDADAARIKISGGVGNYRTTLDDRTLAGNDVKFDGLTEGSYSYKVIDGNNCSETFDFVMTEPANLSFVFVDSTDVKCYNKNNGKLLAVIKGGVANYVYDVTSTGGASINKKTTNSTEYSYNSIAAGKYMLNVTDANNCVISQSYTIGQPDPLTVSVNKLKDVDCKGAETGAVSATAKGGIGAYSYSWNKGMTGHIAQNLPAGEYSVLVTDANNCQSEVDENGVKAQTTIDEPAAALTMLDPAYTNPTCSYNEDGIITINVSGGWGGYGYTLNGVSYGSNKIEGLDEGTYTAKVKDAGGCEVSTNTITLKKPKALSFESSVGTIICNGGTTEVTITSASGGTEGNYSYSIDGEKTWQSGTTFTGVKSDDYMLKMKDGNGCTTEHAVNVTEPDKLVLKEDVWHNYNGTTRKANGKITVTPQGGVMPYSYQWKDTTVTSQVLDNIGFGLYTIIVTDKLGCVETNTYYINDNNPTPEVVDAICPEGTDGSIRFGETVECTRVEWYNARTEEQLMQSDTKTITGLPKGIYKAKLFNNTQVTYIYAEVKAPDSLEYVQNQTDIDCHGDDSGKASVSITGGVAPVSVVWENQKGEEISRNQTIENLITGKYTAYISDAQNCQSSSKTLVFDITEPTDAFVLDENTHNNVKCYGNNDGVVVLRTSGNQGDVTYFQNGAAIPSNEAKSLYAGDYTFYAVDAKNCKTQTMNVVVSQPEPLSSSVKTIMPIKCAAETGSVEVEAEGGTTPYSYKVLEQNDFRLSPIFDGLTTDDYKFVVKDVNNCYDTASYLLTEPEQLVITGNQLKDEYCGHSDGSISIEIAGGTGGYDTRWSDYQTGESASDLAAGSYQVSVFDENRCLATETYEIKNIPAPVVSIRNIDSTKCYGSADGVAELNVSLGTGAISYLWATDTTDVPYSGKLKAGLQSVVAVDELGCADTTQFTMPQPDSMKIVIAVQNPLCFNDNSGKLTASVSNFKTGLSYIWDNGVDGNEIADLYAGTYGVSVTNANGCIAKKNATLVYPAKITIKKVAIADTKCDQPNGSVSVSATGGTGILKYGVNPENMAAANKIEGLQSGNHKLTVIDENQCSIDTAIFVGAKVPPELVINTLNDVKCQGEANGKVSVGVNGGMEPFAYSWNNGNRTTSSTQNGFKVGNHTVLVFDAYGCSDTLSFAINEPDNLVIYEGTIVDPTCFGYSDGQIKADVLGGTRPYSYQWSNNQSVAQATGLPAGSHYLNVTDKNGCKAKKYFSLTNPLPVVVDIPDVIDICSNQTADIDAGYEGSFHYWSSANGFESVAQNISVNKKGTYVVTVTTLDGCIGTDSTFVNVSDKEINSNFLLQSDAYVGDTIVMIEISWPLPESIEWSCPDGMTIISDAGDEIEIVADKEGVYDIGLTTYNDICTEQTFKSIVVNPRAQKPKQMLQAAPKIIKSVNVYPSPTTGPFNLEIELNEEHDVSIEVVHISGKLQTVRHMKGDRNYVLNFSNAELNAGIHTISVSAGAEKVTKKVVIVK